VACPPSTKRFIGVLTAATKSSCQCKEGDVSEELAFVGFDGLRLLALQATLAERADPERCDALRRVCCRNELFASVHLTPLRLGFPRLAYIRLILGARSWTFHFAGVRDVYDAPLSLRLEVSASSSESVPRCWMRRSNGFHL
jgi:hypothetical protein